MRKGVLVLGPDVQLSFCTTSIAAACPAGTKNCTAHMERYVYRRRNDGIFVFDLGKTWEKLQLAARIIVAIENPEDIITISARPYGQRAVMKFGHYSGTKAVVGRHTPGVRDAEVWRLLEWRQRLSGCLPVSVKAWS
jgi:ribosomal protein uS2